MTLENIKVGDKPWSIQLGLCDVVFLAQKRPVIVCKNDEDFFRVYTIPDGKYSPTDLFPSLFPAKPDLWGEL
jgi:hypothetical protein